MLKKGPNNSIKMTYRGHTTIIPLPYADLWLYRVDQLTIDLNQEEVQGNFAGTSTGRRFTCNMMNSKQGGPSRVLGLYEVETSSSKRSTSSSGARPSHPSRIIRA